MRREVFAFHVHCTFVEDGCKWKGEVRHLEVLVLLNKNYPLMIQKQDCLMPTSKYSLLSILSQHHTLV